MAGLSRAVSAVTGGPEYVTREGQRSVEDAVRFALSHRTRAELLAALHEGPATTPQLAKTLNQPRARLRFHVDELLADGSIEVASEERAANVMTKVYRVTKLPFYTEDDWRNMTMAERQVTSALILQAAWAEAISSLYAGKFHSDPRVAVIWNRILLDPAGRLELANEQKRSWETIQQIEADAAHRRVGSGEVGVSYVVTSLGYERSRTSAPDPQLLEAGICEPGSQFGSRNIDGFTQSVAKAVSHSIGHRIRIEILAALHEGPAAAADLARMIGQPVQLLDYHVDQLLKDGAIEVVGSRRKRNLEQDIYGVVRLPFYSDDEWITLSPQDRQVFSAISLRAAIAESMTSLWAGKFHSDPHVMVAWNRILLDREGREALADEQGRSWREICEIENSARARLEEAGSDGRMYVVTLLGYERSRTTAPAPLRD